MKKNRKLIASAIVITVLVTAAFLVFYLVRSSVKNRPISGTISNLVDKPNRAEDGYHGIEVRADNGQQYTINATGFMNTPASPDDLGLECSYVPEVKVGDKVSFILPRSEYEQSVFDICYKKGLTGYFFKVQ